MNKYLLIIVLLFSLYFSESQAQFLYGVVPDTGSQNMSFPITVTGSQTFWTASTYVEIFFDSLGLYTTNVVIVNDTVLNASLHIMGTAALGYRRVTTGDQFLNFVFKDSAFFVRLSAPSVPNLVLPLNNAQLVATNPLCTWDTNGYATTFRIQMASDSNFVNIVKDTTRVNIQGYHCPDILQINTFYWWRVKFFNSLGESPWSAVFKFKTKITGISQINTDIPGVFKLYNNYPNPFNPVTKINFDLPKKNFVNLSVYDITGRKIAELVNQLFDAGSYEVSWNGSNTASGIYFYRIITNNPDGSGQVFSETKRMALIK
jgi:hypothetical protein